MSLPPGAAVTTVLGVNHWLLPAVLSQMLASPVL
ncbi:rCG35152, isoform CRA_c [Rattus norvegicus]|uniref:RCG35152, isoform CRA_c n=1 Tax=Rattus norvegicus TaxID=10116 RepID=A6HL88_RAT|nr:rCG35152, isoform CRA_c [Rattus norvegicus]